MAKEGAKDIGDCSLIVRRWLGVGVSFFSSFPLFHKLSRSQIPVVILLAVHTSGLYHTVILLLFLHAIVRDIPE